MGGEADMHRAALSAATKPWRCLGCDYPLGAVHRGRLYIDNILVLAGIVECPHCHHTRQWHRTEGGSGGRGTRHSELGGPDGIGA